MIMWARDYFRVLPEVQNLDDYDFLNLTYEFAMNYTHEGFRKAYSDYENKKKTRVSADMLRELGYSEEDIAKETDIF